MHNFTQNGKYNNISTLLLGALLYPNNDDLIEVFYTSEKMYIFYTHRAYTVHYTVINLLAIL